MAALVKYKRKRIFFIKLLLYAASFIDYYLIKCISVSTNLVGGRDSLERRRLLLLVDNLI